jgi:hypothetical protein
MGVTGVVDRGRVQDHDFDDYEPALPVKDLAVVALARLVARSS